MGCSTRRTPSFAHFVSRRSVVADGLVHAYALGLLWWPRSGNGQTAFAGRGRLVATRRHSSGDFAFQPRPRHLTPRLSAFLPGESGVIVAGQALHHKYRCDTQIYALFHRHGVCDGFDHWLQRK